MAIQVRNFVISPVRAAFESVLSRPGWGTVSESAEEDEHTQLISGWVSREEGAAEQLDDGGDC